MPYIAEFKPSNITEMDYIDPLDFIRKDNQFGSLMKIPDDAFEPIQNHFDDYETISEVDSLPFVPQADELVDLPVAPQAEAAHPYTTVDEFVEYEAARFQNLKSITQDLDSMLTNDDMNSKKY